MALVVFLRGLNVGGRRTFQPAALAREMKHLGAVNIGAAGTFVIRKPVSRLQLRAEIRRRLPFDAEIMICRGSEIRSLLVRDYFARYPKRPDIIRFVSILSRLPRSKPPLPLQLPSGGRWLVKILAREGRFLAGLYRRRMKVIGYLGSLDRLFGARITTRNWNTFIAIAKILDTGTGE